MKKLTLGLAVVMMFASSAYVLARDIDRKVVKDVWFGDEDMPGPRGHNAGMAERRIIKKHFFDDKKRPMKMRRGKKAEAANEKVMEVIKKHDAAFAKKLEKLRNDKPVKYRYVIRHAGKMFLFARRDKDEALEKDIVRSMVLDYEARELGLAYEEASGSEKERIKKELNGKVSELFDLKLKGQEARMKKMDEKISKLRKNLAKRKTNKSAIVENRVSELVGEEDSWKW